MILLCSSHYTMFWRFRCDLQVRKMMLGQSWSFELEQKKSKFQKRGCCDFMFWWDTMMTSYPYLDNWHSSNSFWFDTQKKDKKNFSKLSQCGKWTKTALRCMTRWESLTKTTTCQQRPPSGSKNSCRCRQI